MRRPVSSRCDKGEYPRTGAAVPNTLAHFGVQGTLTRLTAGGVDARWILLGSVVPDMPWILQRALGSLHLSLPPYDTRLYFIAQASLLVSLLLCGALALLSAKPWTIFRLLAAQAALHLLLDATQTKWGNGVHLFLPVRWEQVNLGWFWPESPVSYALTILGVAFVVWAWVSGGGRSIALRFRDPFKIAAAAGLMLAYALLPVALMNGLERSDSHSVGTLRERQLRPGRKAAFDRIPYRAGDGTGEILTFGHEAITVVGAIPPESGVVSARGVFVSPDTLRVTEVRVQRGRWREYSSLTGLVALLLLWLIPREPWWRYYRRAGSG